MANIVGFYDIVKEIKESLESKDILLYAFNATGKTRLSCEFDSDYEQEESQNALCYNAIIEDYFTWDNIEKTMFLTPESWLCKFVKDEGLDGRICENFRLFTDSKLQPKIDFESGEIQFFMATGDDQSQLPIKISKGEETLFKWNMFYTVMEYALEILEEKEEDRTTDKFNALKYIIIDDPISSLDDYKIYTLSMQLLMLMKMVHDKHPEIKFLITTHHALFFNIIYNTLKNRKEKQISYVMSKNNLEVELRALRRDETLLYHQSIIEEIMIAIANETLQKKHFNMFRSVLEKFTVFLGYENWLDLFDKYSEKDSLNKLINMNSHERYADMEAKDLTAEQLKVFKDGFDYFKSTYKIKV